MKYQIPQPTERQKYWAPDIPGDLESAYSLLAMTNPAGFRELVKFDRQQARRDEVYRHRHSRLNADYDRAVSDTGIEQVELVAAMPLDDRCKSICTMLLQGYKQCDIACMLHISDARVSQLKAKIGKVLEQDNKAAMQSDSQDIYKLNVPKIIREWQRIEQAEQSGSKAAIQPSEQVSQVGAQMSSNRDNETHIRGKETGVPQ